VRVQHLLGRFSKKLGSRGGRQGDCDLPNQPKHDDLSEWKACRRKKKQINDDLKRILIKVGGGETGVGGYGKENSRLWGKRVE
jgi:hypothetical protein